MALPPSTTLNPWTTLYTPSNADSTQLIILCTWLGASRRTIPKYNALYQSLTPQTPILLIESSIWTVTPHYAIQRSRARPAVSILKNVVSESRGQGVEPKILIHVASNGGSNSATQLLLEYRSIVGMPLPVQGVVCDSAPAAGGYWKSYHSIQRSLAGRGVLGKCLGVLAGHAIPGWMYVNAALGRYPVFEELIRETLLSGEWVVGRGGEDGGGEPPEGKEGEGEVKRRIAYIWSKGDELIEWRDIVEHAKEAERRGWEVRSEEFLESGHCDHLKVDGERYTRIVQEAWNAE